MSTLTDSASSSFSFSVTFAKLPGDVLAVGRPSQSGLELVLTEKADDGPEEATNARFWRDKVLDAVGRHLMAMAVVSHELGSAHEVEPFIVSEECAYIQSTIQELSECLSVVGVVPL